MNSAARSNASAAAKVFQLVRAWLAGRPSPPTLKMTVNGNSIEIVPEDDQQDALVEEFIKSMQSSAAPAAES